MSPRLVWGDITSNHCARKRSTQVPSRAPHINQGCILSLETKFRWNRTKLKFCRFQRRPFWKRQPSWKFWNVVWGPLMVAYLGTKFEEDTTIQWFLRIFFIFNFKKFKLWRPFLKKWRISEKFRFRHSNQHILIILNTKFRKIPMKFDFCRFLVFGHIFKMAAISKFFLILKWLS